MNPDTDGDGILDGDEVFGQKKQQTVETHDEAITEIIVDMDTNGNLERNLTIESMYDIDAMSSNVYALIGEPFNFETPTSFNSAKITFKIDKTKLGDTKFDNLLILWYNEEEQIFEEMETLHDEANSTVSTTTTHFSQYMIVDSEAWHKQWDKSFEELKKMWIAGTSYYKSMNTVIVVDCSWKMAGKDNINYRSIELGYNGVTTDNYSNIRDCIDSGYNTEYYYEKYGRRQCMRTSICENIINNMNSGDRIALMMYDGNGVQYNTGLTSSYGSLMSMVQKVNNSGGALYLNDAVSTALSYVTTDIENMYRIIVITNGNVSCNEDDLASYNYDNVSLNIVSLGGGNLDYIENEDINVYYGYPSSALTSASGYYDETLPQFMAVDSDEDGIPDIVELYGLKPNGQLIDSDPYSKHSDEDGLEDNEELYFSMESMTYELDKSQYDGSVFVWSDPCLEDTDGDGYFDNEDFDPNCYDDINGLLYQSNHKMGIGYIEGEIAEDLMTADYSYDDMDVIHNNFEEQLNSSVESLEKDFKSLMSLFAWKSNGNEIVSDLINVFMNGTSNTIAIKTNKGIQNLPVYTSSLLYDRISADQQVQKYLSYVEKEFNNQIKLNNGNIVATKRNMQDIIKNSSVSQIVFSRDNLAYLFGGLTLSINDLWGSNVCLKEFKCDGNKYSGTLHITLYDHFGLDKPDVEKIYVKLDGFRAWFVLQHYDKFNGKYQPFINLFEYDIPIFGEF